MKKVFLIMAAGLFLAACSNEPMYTSAKRQVFMFHGGLVPYVAQEDTFDGMSVTTFKNDQGLLIKDENSDFELQVTENPPQVTGISFESRKVDLTEENNYKLGMKIENDTLYLLYGPTDKTPEDAPKMGLQYKFYK